MSLSLSSKIPICVSTNFYLYYPPYLPPNPAHLFYSLPSQSSLLFSVLKVAAILQPLWLSRPGIIIKLSAVLWSTLFSLIHRFPLLTCLPSWKVLLYHKISSFKIIHFNLKTFLFTKKCLPIFKNIINFLVTRRCPGLPRVLTRIRRKKVSALKLS